MNLERDLISDVSGILTTTWSTRDGRSVPGTEAIALTGGAVRLEAAILYADLRRSSLLATKFDRRLAAKVFKSFLHCACTIISSNDGVITSFDGDRVMAVFVGEGKEHKAAIVALLIKYAVEDIIEPRLRDHFMSLGRPFKTLQVLTFRVRCGIGVDTGDVLAVRAGRRKDNDLIWIGRPPNFAATLSDLSRHPFSSCVSKEVFDALDRVFLGLSKRSVWRRRKYKWLGEELPVYESKYSLPPHGHA